MTADSASARFTVDAAVPAVISAWPASDYFGVSGLTPGENVNFTIRDAGGDELASGSKLADVSGLAGFSRPQDFSVDLAAGMEVTVRQGTITKTLILAPITITSFSPATDTVAGTAAPRAQLDVYLWTPAGNSPTIQVTADADGTWSVTFAPYDITYAATAYAAIGDVDGDATRVSRQAPGLKGDVGSDAVNVYGFAPGGSVELTIREFPGGTALASASKQADGSGYAWFGRQDFSVDLAAGMELTASQDALTKTLTLAPLTITSISPDTDTVAGTAPPGAQLEVYVYTLGSPSSPTRQVTAADGTWSLNFAPYDITYTATANASLRDTDGDTTSFSRTVPRIEAWLNSDWISVNGFTSGGSVELTIRQAPQGTVLASASKQADGSGYTSFGRSQDFGVDLVAGMEVTVSQGTATKRLTLAPITITSMSPDTDTVGGTGPTGEQLELSVYDQTGNSPTKQVIADADGNWSLNFAPYDITYTATASAKLRDSDGDTTSLTRASPRVDASPNADSISVYGFTLGGDVDLTIRQSPGGAVLASASKQADGTGYAWFGTQDFSVDLVAGMELTVSQGTVTKTLTLAPLALTAVSPDTDTVAGTAPAGSQLEVYVVNVASSSSPTKLVTPAADGTWSLNFGPYDITYTATATAKLRDSDGDATYVYRQAPVLTASLNDDSIGALGFTPGSTVQFTIRSASGTVLATGVKQSSSYGHAGFSRFEHGVDLIAGMQLTVEGGTITKELTLAPLTIASLEPDADTVAGTAPPGAQLEVYVANRATSSPTSRVIADGNGSWSVDFTGVFDITHTASAYVTVRDTEGDATSVVKQLPRITASLSSDGGVSAYGFAPSGTVKLTIRESPGGTVLASPSKQADATGYTWFGPQDFSADLVAGMELTVTDGTTVKELTLPALAITYVNQVRNVVAGTAPAGARLDVYVYNQGSSSPPSPTKQVTADGGGKWSADFTGVYDITGTGGAYVTHYDNDGDAISQLRMAESDTTPPVATFDAGPSGLTNDATPSFAFSAKPLEPASFECRVDGAAFADCSSPHTTAALGDGPHMIEVRATDTAGNIGSAAARAFTVDTAPPVTSIDAGPSGTIDIATPTFVFSAGEPASFECRVDGNAFAACTSPYTTAPLADGVHSFEVRATDTAGNTGTAVATTFTVTTPTPGGGGGGGGAGNPDLNISIVASRAAVEIGGSVDLTVTVRNNGPQSGTGIVLVITLPETATLLGPPSFDRGSGCTGTTPLSCNLDFLPAGVQSTVRFSIGLRQAGPQTVTAKVTSVEGDLAAADNVGAVTITVAAAPPTTPPVKPSLFRPVLGAPTYVPTKPVAGQALRVSLVVRRSDNGALLRSGKVICDPSIAGRMIRHTESFGNGVVKISLKVPNTAKGKLLRIKVTFRISDRSTTRIASVRIR